MNKRTIIIKFLIYDVLSALIIWLLFMVFRRVANDLIPMVDLSIFVPYKSYYITFFAFPILSIFIHYITGYYIDPIKQSLSAIAIKTLVASIIVSFTVFFMLVLDDIAISYRYYYHSLFILLLLNFIIIYAIRLTQSLRIRAKFKNKTITYNTLIIGSGTNALNIHNDIKRSSIHNTVVGFIKIFGEKSIITPELIVGQQYDIDKIIKSKNIEEVIIAIDNAKETTVFEIAGNLFKHNISIKYIPLINDIISGKAKIEQYGINPLVNLTKKSISDWEYSIKRVLDILVSFVSLIALSPLILILAIIIRLDSKGGIFFKQERIGLHSKPFNILKFRTMRPQAESTIPQLSSINDDRVTKIGRFLRKYRLDEIPQFVNVLIGQMSIVGPRPERKYYIDKILEEAPYYCLIYQIRPGLTSWGPIKIGYSDTIEKMILRLNLDIVYMENMSLYTDIRIIVATIKVIFYGKGV